MESERLMQNGAYRGVYLIILLLAFLAGEGRFFSAYGSSKSQHRLVNRLKNAGQSDFSGRWQSDFGILDLKQSGSQIEGTYSCCGGRLTGVVKGNTVDFVWKDPIFGEGWGKFTLDASGERLTGVWGTKNDTNAKGKWNGIRFREKKFEGTATYWELAGSHAQAGELRGRAILYLSGTSVGGKLEGVYVRELNNLPLRIEVFNYLQGRREGARYILTWENPMDGSRGNLILDGDDNRLRGQWSTQSGEPGGTITFTRTSSQDSAGVDEISATRRIEDARSLSEGDSHLKKGRDLETQSRCREAITEYKEAARIYAKTGKKEKLATAYYATGACHLALGEYQVAREFFKQVLDLGPEAGETNRLLASTGIELVNIKLGIPPK